MSMLMLMLNVCVWDCVWENSNGLAFLSVSIVPRVGRTVGFSGFGSFVQSIPQ